ncbi:putative quinol monooxygenase [Acuticoccus sp.]|uniref:putative quinol monooxygenase n=1 Tax=Acuticoccus sp. TaxID=1904378 RepID=UPI003B516181
MIKVVAVFLTHEGQEEAAAQHLGSVVEPTRQEDGCQQYDLWRDPKDPRRFVMDELWESRDHLKAHSQSDHIGRMREATKEVFASREVYVLDRVA